MKKDTYLYVVRHGESEGNVDHLKRGSSASLTEKGRAQAESIAARTKNLPVEIIISSTMTRAQETAEIISKAVAKKVVTNEFAHEHKASPDFAPFPINDLRYQSLFKKIFHEDDGKDVSGGESFDELKARAQNLLASMEERPEEHILLVSHGLLLRALLGVVLIGGSLTSKQFYHLTEHTVSVKNTGVTVFRHWNEEHYGRIPGWRLVTWNDYAHLG